MNPKIISIFTHTHTCTRRRWVLVQPVISESASVKPISIQPASSPFLASGSKTKSPVVGDIYLNLPPPCGWWWYYNSKKKKCNKHLTFCGCVFSSCCCVSSICCCVFSVCCFVFLFAVVFKFCDCDWLFGATVVTIETMVSWPAESFHVKGLWWKDDAPGQQKCLWTFRVKHNCEHQGNRIIPTSLPRRLYGP